MASERRTLSDLEQMRAVSHPARWRVLEELWSGRVLTATDAAELVGMTPSAMSYHLQQLARHGLIERDEAADGREHPWRASTQGVSMTAQPDPPLGRTMMQNLSLSISRVLMSPPPNTDDPRPWPASYSHRTLNLTPARAKELHQRVNDVISQYTDDTDDIENTDETAGTGGDAATAGGELQQYDVFWIQGVAGTGSEPR